MKLLIILLVAALATLTLASPAKDKKIKCDIACPFDYTPVCAGPETGNEKPKSFGNACVVDKYNCDHDSKYVVKSQGECAGGGGVRLQ